VIGDVSPNDGERLWEAFGSDTSGVQVDFDDGFCPSWSNVLLAHRNVGDIIHRDGVMRSESTSSLSPLPHSPKRRPTMMFRPRAWNMREKHVVLGGRALPGPVFDFCVHVARNGERIVNELADFITLYLSKVERYEEALLWDEMFAFSEGYFGWPQVSD